MGGPIARNRCGARVNPETARTASGVLSGLAGSVGGWLLSEHHGLPVVAMLLLVAASVAFGLVSSTEKKRDIAERRNYRRAAVFNFGTLWVTACSASFAFDLTLSIASAMGLGVGLMGNAMLERIEGNSLLGDIVTKLAKWWLERGVK